MPYEVGIAGKHIHKERPVCDGFRLVKVYQGIGYYCVDYLLVGLKGVVLLHGKVVGAAQHYYYLARLMQFIEHYA
jgi:hypothetical protein